MKATLQISHSETDDLARLQAAARKLGWDVTSRGGFLGKHHTEICIEMDAARLAVLLESVQDKGSVAA
jgi:hypothetical protein